MSANANADAPVAPGDPTASKGLRDKFEKRFQARWRSLRGDVRNLLRGDRHYRPTSDRDDASVQVADFREWLDGKLDSAVVEPVPSRAQRAGRHWTGSHVRQLYVHGLRRADESLEAADYDAGALPSPEAALRREPHRDALRGSYIEAHQDTVDAANAAERDATRAYRDAVRGGEGVRPTVSAVNDRLDKVGDTRSKLVARSKAVIVVNDAALNRYASAGADDVGVVPESVAADADVDANAGHAHDAFQFTDRTQPAPGDEPEQMWVTAGDRRVCPACASLAGVTFSIEDVRNGDAPMPVRDTHPSCRCYLTVI